MSYIYDLDPKHLATLLASSHMDVANSALNSSAGANLIAPDTHNRTILIGMGGTGLKTLNDIKRAITQRLQPQWTKYIAFLAIDSDASELEKNAYLDRAEFVNSTRPGIINAVNAGKQEYPRAWLPFVDEKKARELTTYNSDGAGRKRLMGKMKMHYAPSEDKGVDEDIVAKIESLKSKQLAPLVDKNSNYEVYIIGGLCGGTCSGGFIQMPALVQKALNVPGRVNVNAMLYLPDTVTELDPKWKDELMANGYASLKELNYYQGMFMRPGQSETFSYNAEENPELYLDHETGFYNLPYLIGTANGAQPDSAEVARKTIAEYFVSILGKMTASGAQDVFLVNSFLSNALEHMKDKPLNSSFASGEVEAPFCAHEFPKRYGTIGFAKAAAPKKIISAYTVAEACRVAGLMPITMAQRKTKASLGETFLPFMGEKQYFSAAEVGQAAKEMTAPLMAYMKKYQVASFDYATKIPGGAATWDSIHAGTADDNSVRGTVKRFVEASTDTKAAKALEEAVKEQFRTFRGLVKTYVQENGPMAFYNLYHGNAEVPQGSKQPKGIQDILKYLVDDVNPETDKPNTYPDSKNLMANKNKLGAEIQGEKDGFFGKLGDALKGERATKAGNWIKMYNVAVNAEINEKRREYMLGQVGILKKHFLEPAEELAKQLFYFGLILEKMSNGYQENGSKLNDFQAFTKVSDNITEVNIAALNPQAHEWLQDEAKRMAQNVDAKKVRKALVDSFFEDTMDWMEVDDNLVKIVGESYMLKSEDMPVAARSKFDTVISENISINMDVSISNLFVQLNGRNVSFADYAKQIVDELSIKSKPLFDGRINDRDIHCYIMYPRSLDNDNPQVVAAIKNEVANREIPIQFFASDYADAIMMYQMVAPFEIYALKALGEWEKHYEVKMKEQGNGLHGMSPDVTRSVDRNGIISYTEKTSWYDYPSIVYRANPQERDAKGKVSHEGEVRNRLDKEIIDKAIELGLLYCDRDDDDRYQVYCVKMDDSVKWRFNIDLMDTDNDGLYPMGAELIRAVVEQNGVDMEVLTSPVLLAMGGMMSESHSTEEIAWKYARRTLYMNRQLLNQIRDTMDRVAPWTAEVMKENEVIMRKFKPAKMLRIIMGRGFYPNEKQVWSVVDEDDRKFPVVSMAPTALNRLTMTDPEKSAIVEAGFHLYYLYTNLLELEQEKKVDLDVMLKQAKAALKAYADPDELDESIALAQSMMKKETAILLDMDADLDNPDQKPLKAFVNKMRALEIEDTKLITDICKFYSALKYWKKV